MREGAHLDEGDGGDAVWLDPLRQIPVRAGLDISHDRASKRLPLLCASKNAEIQFVIVEITAFRITYTSSVYNAKIAHTA